MNFDWTIEHLFAGDHILMGLPMLRMHHLFARDEWNQRLRKENTHTQGERERERSKRKEAINKIVRKACSRGTGKRRERMQLRM